MRVRAGLTQLALAERLAISNRQVSHIETGRSAPSLQALESWVAECGFRMVFQPLSEAG